MDWLHRLRGEDPAARGRAAELVNEAVALSDAGRHAEALALEEQAVRLLRNLRRVPRTEIVPLLARAVLYHSGDLAAVGDTAGALSRAEEALALAQEVAAAGRGRPESLPLAQANLAARLLQSGRAVEALPHARAAAGATAALPERAGIWIQGTLAQVLAATGEDAEASAVSEQALTSARRAIKQRNTGPHEQATGSGQADATTLEAEAARALTNDANRLLRAGRWQEALDTATEAVARYRALAARNRLAYLPGLARALSNQTIMFTKVARWDECLAASREAVELQREISAADPVAGRPGLASALTSYAIGLATTDREDEARPVMAEALEIYRALAASQPDAYLGKLAEAVSNHASLVETDEERLRLYRESVALRRKLAAQNRAVHLPWLARALGFLADQLAVMGRIGPAVDTGDEAIRLARESFAANRAGFLPYHALLLREQAKRLDEAGHSEAAITLGTEAVEICRESVAANRRRQLPGLAAALSQQADRILAQPKVSRRQAEQARALQEEATGLRAEIDGR
ncbi:hypothetical protein [Actinoplanes sp. NPDC049802]|uniref:hypothetical protein n=1 Tax=Actinoplanes sp. NPDC049802 TaxID=3154742 RepID=UPI0033C5AB6A